jgi:hypothetical protein
MRNKGARLPRSVLVTVLAAAVVTAGVLIAVTVLRPHPDGTAMAGAAPDPSPQPPSSVSNCGPAPCRQVAATTVSGVEVALLAAPDGSSGSLRFGPEAANATMETTITKIGARLGPDSLRCAAGVTTACLVRGTGDGGVVAEVLARRGDSWQGTGKPYFSDAGTISLSDADGSGSPDVIVVRHECPGSQPGSAKCLGAPVIASVFDLAGNQVGCTKKYTAPSQIRGWPDIKLVKADLRPCS